MMSNKTLRRASLSAALALCIAGPLYAQSTTGNINGSVPAASASNTTVLITNNSGFSRTVPVDADGNYRVSNLPVGTYTVTVQRDGQAIGSRQVTVVVGAAADASFSAAGGGTTDLETVTVAASAPAAIDLSSVDTRTVITAEQIARLPLGRSAEALALLAPGAVAGASGYGALSGLVSFGGSGVSENA